LRTEEKAVQVLLLLGRSCYHENILRFPLNFAYLIDGSISKAKEREAFGNNGTVAAWVQIHGRHSGRITFAEMTFSLPIQKALGL